MAEQSRQLREIAEYHGIDDAEVLSRALERGLEELWVDAVVGRYLDGDLTRESAVQLAGLDRVRRAERDSVPKDSADTVTLHGEVDPGALLGDADLPDDVDVEDVLGGASGPTGPPPDRSDES